MNYKFLGIDVFGIKKEARSNPQIFQCWYLHLKYLINSLKNEIFLLPNSEEKILLDIGSSDNFPYHHFFKNKVKKY